MGAAIRLDIGTLFAFLLVLARMAGVFTFIPLPGIKAGAEPARVVLSVFMTFVLFSSWPQMDSAQVSFGLLLGWLIAEAGMGVAVGLVTAFLTEGFQMGTQIISLQAGYTFATTIDPTSGADSSVLLTVAQLTAGMLFFATGFDRQILYVFAQSLHTHPVGQFAFTQSMANAVIQMGASIFVTGLRLVLPLLGLLIMVELSLALLARLNSQLHLMSLVFPIKMLLSLTLLAWLVLVFPKVFSQTSAQVLQLIKGLLS
ncbi:MAG TPA: flagellar biosynthetic protein FliR [Bryobacteraceae bacterium]